MAFRVEIAPRAYEDLDQIAGHIAAQGGFEQAEMWFNGIISAIASLRDMPSRCRIAEESEVVGQVVRCLLCGRRNRRYKVYFAIRPESRIGGMVQVFHVRHWARRPLTAREFKDLTEDLGE